MKHASSPRSTRWWVFLEAAVEYHDLGQVPHLEIPAVSTQAELRDQAWFKIAAATIVTYCALVSQVRAPKEEHDEG